MSWSELLNRYSAVKVHKLSVYMQLRRLANGLSQRPFDKSHLTFRGGVTVPPFYSTSIASGCTQVNGNPIQTNVKLTLLKMAIAKIGIFVADLREGEQQKQLLVTV